MGDLSTYFNKSEFACKCGCGLCNYSSALFSKLDELRARLDSPVILTSGARCKAYNAKVGGKPDSAHLYGQAVDISAGASRSKFLIIESALLCGFKRIGFHKEFIHLDIDGSKDQEVMWLY